VPDYLLERTTRGPGKTPEGRALLGGMLRTLLRAIPTDARIDAFLEVHRPDLIALTPLIEPGAPQAEYVRSARALGIPTALCVASWDNLTNKGLIHGPVDLITVWNAMMKEEAITHHGIPEEKIVVTGAQPFDHWFGWQPSVGREAFCRQVGLPPDRPYILYVCSSRFIAPEEVPFVRSWLQHLRQSGVCAGVLIRPHPQNAEQWRQADLREYGPAVVWPLAGATPSDTESRGDYFNSIVHSAAVIGINTTAEIESAIVGRGVLTILAPEFQATQEGTLHFEHLRRADGGLVRVAQTFSEHVEQLNETLRDPQVDGVRCRRFVEAFVRPYGIDAPATPRVVEALERLAQRGRTTAERSPWWAPVLRAPLARRGNQLRREALVEAERKALRARRKKGTAAARARATQ